MYGELKHEGIEEARRDLEARTLAHIRGDFSRLVYLASLRDYNTGEYHHEGLERRYSTKLANGAIAACHWNVFKRLVSCSMRVLVGELELYRECNAASQPEFVNVWQKLQPYQVTLPLTCSSLTMRFFAANVKTALLIIQSRLRQAGRDSLSS
jgi:hypothetical protein